MDLFEKSFVTIIGLVVNYLKDWEYQITEKEFITRSFWIGKRDMLKIDLKGYLRTFNRKLLTVQVLMIRLSLGLHKIC